MQPTPSNHFSKLEILIILGLLVAISIAYIMQSASYKKTKQEIIDIPTVQPVITGINISKTPLLNQSQTKINQCSSNRECGQCQQCEEGLCVKQPNCQNTIATPAINMPTPLICPSGLVRVCEAGVCSCAVWR